MSRARRQLADDRLVFVCLPVARNRGRLQSVLKGHATMRLFETFDELRHALEGDVRPAAAVVAMTDGVGLSVLDFARDVRDDMTGTPVVVYCDLEDEGRTPMSAFAEVGVHDVLFTGVNDEGYGARDVIFGAAVAAAADVVIRAAQPLVPDSLLPFVETAARRPRDLQRVRDLAAAMRLPRQTLSRWCRAHRFVSPEELIVWVRLFIVGVLLETTSRTLESIATDLHYGSPATLRNRIRDYTGVTASEIRAGGLDVMVTAFRRRLDQARAESTLRMESTKAG